MGEDPGANASYSYHVPRLLAFYQDQWDEDGTALGWRPVAWGLRFADGSAVSISVEGKPAVTLWQSVEDATEALDAYVDTPEPRAHLEAPLPPPPPPRPAGSVLDAPPARTSASTTSSAPSASSSAAPSASSSPAGPRDPANGASPDDPSSPSSS
jgi:hypothetical protein